METRFRNSGIVIRIIIPSRTFFPTVRNKRVIKTSEYPGSFLPLQLKQLLCQITAPFPISKTVGALRLYKLPCGSLSFMIRYDMMKINNDVQFREVVTYSTKENIKDQLIHGTSYPVRCSSAFSLIGEARNLELAYRQF